MPRIAQDRLLSSITANLGGAQNTRITNLTCTLANTEYSHALISNLKQLVFKARNTATLKISFTSGESGTKYITIYKGSMFTLGNMDLTSQTLYVQASIAGTIVEILETY